MDGSGGPAGQVDGDGDVHGTMQMQGRRRRQCQIMNHDEALYLPCPCAASQWIGERTTPRQGASDGSKVPRKPLRLAGS